MEKVAPVADMILPPGTRKASSTQDTGRTGHSQADPHQAGAETEHELDQPLPKVTNIAPVMFVPIFEDFTQPIEPPRNRLDRVKRMLDSIDLYERGVEANLHRIMAHEKRRIVQRVRQYERQHGPTGEPAAGITPEESEDMIGSMRAPADPDADYNFDVTAQDLCLLSYFTGEDEPYTRGNGFRQLQFLVEQGCHEIDDFKLHMAQVRQRWQATLEKEERVIDGFAGPEIPLADDVAWDA